MAAVTRVSIKPGPAQVSKQTKVNKPTWSREQSFVIPGMYMYYR